MLANTAQVTVDGTRSAGKCTYTDWQNQWHWAADGTEPAATVAARVYACMANFTSGQLVVFGGLIDAASNNDTWVFEPGVRAGWRLITGLPAPAGRWSAAVCSEGSMMYMHGGAADDASSRSDLWSFNITSLKWSSLLPSACIPDPLSCSFAARGHVLAKFASFLYAWDTLAGRFSRFNLTSNTWEALSPPPIPRFQHLSLAQVSSHVFLSLGLTTDSSSNMLCLITFSSVGDPVKFAAVNASNVPLVVGGCMLAFSSQVLVLGGKIDSGAAIMDYRCFALCC